MSHQETLDAFFRFADGLPDTIRDGLMQRTLLTINPSEVRRLEAEPSLTKEIFRASIETNGATNIGGVIIACGYFDHECATIATDADIQRSKYVVAQMEEKEPLGAAIHGVFARQELNQRHMQKFREDWKVIRGSELSPQNLSSAQSDELSLRSQAVMQDILGNRNPDDK